MSALLGSTLLLTLVTLAGLTAGFAREWLLIASWGAGASTDAFLSAMLLTEMLRTTLAAGLLSAAALPLFQSRSARQRGEWLNTLLPQVALTGLGLSVAMWLLAPWLLRLLTPGLDETIREDATALMRCFAWCIPGIALHALCCIPLQAESRFTLAGMGSLLFNVPQVACLAWYGSRVDGMTLALSAVAGSMLMFLTLIPSTVRAGWCPTQLRLSGKEGGELLHRLGPLLASSGASNAVAILERAVASLLGDGALTWLNFARKMINLPLIALASLNQVMLGLMSRQSVEDKRSLLRQALYFATLLILPTSIGLIGAAPTLVSLLAPAGGSSALTLLLAWLATPLLLGSWNALFARYSYARADTRLPMSCEVIGNLANAFLLCILPFWFNLTGIAAAALIGTIATSLSLMFRLQLLDKVAWWRIWPLGWLMQGLASCWLYPMPTGVQQFGWSIACSLLGGALLALTLRPWK